MRLVKADANGRVVVGRRPVISFGAAKRKQLHKRAMQMAREDLNKAGPYPGALSSAGLIEIHARRFARFFGI